ncbi:dispersed gene family protein 1 (DGF-1), putative, partial [Trypanosoma cruzi]
LLPAVRVKTPQRRGLPTAPRRLLPRWRTETIPTPPTRPPAREILRRQACWLHFPLRPQRRRWRAASEMTPASMTPVCMPRCCSLWLRLRTPLWAENSVWAVRASTQPRGLVRVYCFPK